MAASNLARPASNMSDANVEGYAASQSVYKCLK